MAQCKNKFSRAALARAGGRHSVRFWPLCVPLSSQPSPSRLRWHAMHPPPMVPRVPRRSPDGCRHLRPQERGTTAARCRECEADRESGEAQAAQGRQGGRCLRRAHERHRGAGAALRARHLAGNGGRAGSARRAGARDRCGCSATSSVVPDGSGAFYHQPLPRLPPSAPSLELSEAAF